MKNHRRTGFPGFSSLLLALLLAFSAPAIHADTVKMKNGETYEGTVLYESDDIVRIEVAVTESIKETKVLSRADVAEIIKTPPDVVAYNEIKALVPTDSLVGANQYRTMLETGPNSFLRKFADSQYRDEVEEIKKTLEEELDKVERGFLKLDGEWVTPQDQLDFENLVQSRILLFRMEQAAQRGNYTGLVAAMREYEKLERNHAGSPAFAKAVTEARKIIPVLGRQLQAMLRDVEARNAEWERNKNILSEGDRMRVEQARAREDAQYEAALEADRKAGMKWVRINPRSKEALQDYLSLAGGELEKIRQYDVAQIAARAEELVSVDKLIAEGNLDAAEGRLDRALEMPSGMGEGRRSSKKDGSYVSHVREKLETRLEEREAARKAAEEAKESEALTRNLKAAENPEVPSGSKSGEGEKGDQPGAGKGDEGMAKGKEEETLDDAFAALSGAPSAGEEGEQKAKSKPSGKSSRSDDEEEEEKKDEEEEEDERPAPPPSTGGGFNFGLVVPIVTVVLIVAIVLLKVLGVGGKKEE